MFFFSSRRRHTRWNCDWSSDVCSSDLASNSSAVVFGLPEMMQIGAISRIGSTATITTVEAHGLTTSDKIFVTHTGIGSVDLSFVAVASVPTTTSFTYTSTASGTMVSGAAGTFTRTGSTVTVTSTAHTLATNDRVDIFTGALSLDTTGVTVTRLTANTFSYTMPGSVTVASTPGAWARQKAFYRKYDSGTFSRSSNIVTVNTAANHGLVTGDVITTFVATGNAMNAGNVIVTVVNVTKFTYTVDTSGNIGNTAGFWVRNEL